MTNEGKGKFWNVEEVKYTHLMMIYHAMRVETFAMVELAGFFGGLFFSLVPAAIFLLYHSIYLGLTTASNCQNQLSSCSKFSLLIFDQNWRYWRSFWVRMVNRWSYFATNQLCLRVVNLMTSNCQVMIVCLQMRIFREIFVDYLSSRKRKYIQCRWLFENDLNHSTTDLDRLIDFSCRKSPGHRSRQYHQSSSSIIHLLTTRF